MTLAGTRYKSLETPLPLPPGRGRRVEDAHGACHRRPLGIWHEAGVQEVPSGACKACCRAQTRSPRHQAPDSLHTRRPSLALSLVLFLALSLALSLALPLVAELVGSEAALEARVSMARCVLAFRCHYPDGQANQRPPASSQVISGLPAAAWEKQQLQQRQTLCYPRKLQIEESRFRPMRAQAWLQQRTRISSLRNSSISSLRNSVSSK